MPAVCWHCHNVDMKRFNFQHDIHYYVVVLLQLQHCIVVAGDGMLAVIHSETTPSTDLSSTAGSTRNNIENPNSSTSVLNEVFPTTAIADENDMEIISGTTTDDFGEMLPTTTRSTGNDLETTDSGTVPDVIDDMFQEPPQPDNGGNDLETTNSDAVPHSTDDYLLIPTATSWNEEETRDSTTVGDDAAMAPRVMPIETETMSSTLPTKRSTDIGGTHDMINDSNETLISTNKVFSIFDDTAIQEISDELLDLYQQDNTLTELAASLLDLCPSWKPCYEFNYASLDQMDIPVKCCLACSCDEFCVSRRSCCPGYIPDTTRNGTYTDFEDIPKLCMESVLFTDNWKYLASADEFEMIASCPEVTSIDLKAKCTALLTETDGGLIHKFLDVIPVTDSLTLTTFANRHCAVCNGLTEDRFIFWTSKFECAAEVSYNTVTLERDIQTREDCYLKLIPPSYEIGNTTQCFLHVTSACNVTGLWEGYDAQIERFCNESDWLFYTPSSSNSTSKRYKNIFCAICNGEPFTEVEGLKCPAKVLDDFNRAFTAILNFNPLFDESVASRGNGDTSYCPFGQQLDPLMLMCKEVECSYPRILNKVTMTCEDRYLEFNFGFIEIPLKVLTSPTVTSQAISIFQYEFEYLMKSIDGDTNCNTFQLFYKADKVYDSLQSDFIDNFQVRSIYLLAYVDLSYPYQRTARQIINDYLRVSFTIDGVYTVQFTTGEVDAYYLSITTDEPENGETKRVLYDRFGAGAEPRKKRDIDVFDVLKDPYDGYAILTYNFLIDDIESCERDKLLYPKSYFECPVFVYDLAATRIYRLPSGIILFAQNVQLGFGEFYSINETHVAICLDKLEEKGLQVNITTGTIGSASSSHYISNWIPVLMILFYLVIFESRFNVYM